MSMDNLEVSHALCQYFVRLNDHLVDGHMFLAPSHPHDVKDDRQVTPRVVLGCLIYAQDEVCTGPKRIVVRVDTEPIARSYVFAFHFVISSQRSWTKFAYVMEGSP